jgi:ABC-type nitrate/sulfonate/bicarbonate transport system permease component
MSTDAPASTSTATTPEAAVAVAPDARGRLDRFFPYSVRAKIIVGLFLLAFWEIGVRGFAPNYVARPSRTLPSIMPVLQREDFWSAFNGTMTAMVQGLLLAVVAALVVGLAMGQIRWVGWSLRGYTNAFFSLPMIAVVPLITMWTGYSDSARLAIIIFAAYFPMVLNVYDGARSVSGHYLEVAKSYRAPRRSVWIGVVIPASIPYLIAGFRLASGRALVAAVVAEYLVSIEGRGFYVLINARSNRHEEAMVGVFALMAVGILLITLAKFATRVLAPWYLVKQD